MRSFRRTCLLESHDLGQVLEGEDEPELNPAPVPEDGGRDPEEPVPGSPRGGRPFRSGKRFPQVSRGRHEFSSRNDGEQVRTPRSPASDDVGPAVPRDLRTPAGLTKVTLPSRSVVMSPE